MRFAISDIHGCANTFSALLDHLHFSKTDELFLLGDYIDRGRNSKGVIDRILKLQHDGYSVRCLRGNHEQLLLLGLQGDGYMLNVWQRNGGLETLESYNLYDPEKIPDAHIEFLKSTEFFIELNDYVLVHAGLNFEHADFREDSNAMMWIRNFEVIPERVSFRTVVHGHTPIAYSEMLNNAAKTKESFRLNIDNGCVYTGRKGCGGLVAFNLDTKELVRVENVD